MSVMVINEDNFKRIGKFMSLRNKNIELLCKTLDSWHELNIRNYCKRYEHHGEEFNGLEFQSSGFDFTRIPIPSAVQVVSDLRGLLYNCDEYGMDINPEAFTQLKMELVKVELLPEYKVTKEFVDSVVYW